MGWDNGGVNVYYVFTRIVNAGQTLPSDPAIESTFAQEALSAPTFAPQSAAQLRELINAPTLA
jgi:hypothetical protein